MSPKVSVIIPAYNEEESLPHVLSDLPKDRLHQIIVVDNNSTDRTAEVAREKRSDGGFGEAPGLWTGLPLGDGRIGPS